MPKDVRLIFPARGVSTEAAFIDQPGDTCPPGASRNIRLTNRTTKRPSGSSRGGWRPMFAGTIGMGMVQGLISVQRASSTGYEPGTAAALAGTAKSGDHGTGNAATLDSVPSVIRMFHEDTSDDGGPSTVDVISVQFSADGLTLYTAVNYTNGTNYKSRIKAWSVTTGTVLWSHTISEASVDRFTNTIKVSSWLLLVCGGKTGGVGTVRCLRLSDGTQMGNDFTCNGWAYEAIEADTFGSGASEYAMIAFYGLASAGTTVGGPITAGYIALNFRSGVMRCRIIQPDEVGPFTQYLVQERFSGIGIGPISDLYEADHQYMRISEIDDNSGHGAYIEAMACASNGSFVYCRSNQGYGRDATFSPDPAVNGGLPFVSVAKHNADGTLAWQNNIAESVTDTIGTVGYNDWDNPTFRAIALDSAGNIYVAGRTNSAGFSVYSLSPTGAFRWRANIGIQVRQAAIAIDPADGNVIVGGDRNDLWTGAGGEQACAWKLSANDGSIVWAWDYGSAVSCSSVATSTLRTCLGTEYVA